MIKNNIIPPTDPPIIGLVSSPDVPSLIERSIVKELLANIQ